MKQENTWVKRALFDGEEAVLYYEKCGLAAFENDEFLKSGIYYEWARLEKEKIEKKELARQ
jgi:hypothetical protein